MKSNTNWLKLNNLLDNYTATDEEVKQAFKNRGFINLKGQPTNVYSRS